MTKTPREQKTGETPSSKRVHFLQFKQEVDAFDQAMGEVVRALTQAGQPIPRENVYRLTHGSRWDHPAASQSVTGELQQLSVLTELNLADLRDGKLEVLPLTINQVVEGMKRHFYQNIYSAVSEGAERVGNVVSAQEVGSFAAGFLEMLRRIEFGVDKDGNVSLPEMHVGPGTFEKVVKELEEQPQEYRDEIERIKEEKTSEALEKEQARRSKFVQYRRR